MTSRPKAHSSTLFFGGLVWSPADQAGPQPAELLVVDGRIAAVGEHLGVTDGAQGAERIDLRGGTLLPAFGDGHAHPVQGGIERRHAAVRGDSLEAVLDGVRAWAAEHPGSEWIYGAGFDLALTPDGVFDRHWLDAVVSDRPVVLRGTDYHTLWCNTEALNRSGITIDTPDPANGEIVRREDGSPVGTLREWGATDPVFAAMPRPDPAAQVAALVDAMTICAAAGLTWVQDAWVEPADVALYLAAAGSCALKVAVNLAFRADPTGWPAQVATFVALREQVRAAGHEGLTSRTVKFFVDGVIESGTASMLEPYTDCPHSRGLPNWAPVQLREAVAAFSAVGFQVHLHAIGDAAVRETLDAIEGSYDVISAGDLRPVIAHLQVIDPADLPRLASLGVISCFQPLWAQPDPLQVVLTIPRIGPARAGLQFPIHSVLAAGAAVSFGSDWPVTEVSPLLGLVTAVTRQTPAGAPEGGWFPHERIGLRDAFTAYTRGVAQQAFREDAGTLDEGAVADLVWLDVDPSRASLSEVAAASVLGTWRAGRRIH